MAVGTRARAPAPGLDPEQVVEHRHDEVVVQEGAALAVHDEGQDREPLGLEVARDLDRRLPRPGGEGPTQEVLLAGADDVDADPPP